MLAVIHYGEVALKGDNRKFFEDKLVENIKKALITGLPCPVGSLAGDPFGVFDYVKRISGRILLELPGTIPGEISRGSSPVRLVLQRVFGITYFAFATQCDLDIEVIKARAVEMLKDKNFNSFKVETKRGNKSFFLTSQQVNEQVGEAILEELGIKNQESGIRVDLHNPDVILYVEIIEKYAFLYTEKIAGPGGLPLGVSGKAISLISGGIDSPVASYLMMKRGVENIFVHFFATGKGFEQSLEKVRDILRTLKNYQEKIKVYFVPFSEAQKEIVLKTKADFRVVLYRRLMFLVANEIAIQEKAKALITGESVGQVASQTLDNMLAIEEAVSLPVLRPVCGWDKQEIMDLAKKINTYEISILPHLDCCSMFTPDHPATKANLKDVKTQEKKLKIKKLITSALKNATIESV
ncbi:MAG: tRNA uracil 4-sulfurtransferase ThiI [bacterium]